MSWEDHKYKMLVPAGSAASQCKQGEGKPAALLLSATLKFLCGIKTALHTENITYKGIIRNHLNRAWANWFFFGFAEINHQSLLTVWSSFVLFICPPVQKMMTRDETILICISIALKKSIKKIAVFVKYFPLYKLHLERQEDLRAPAMKQIIKYRPTGNMERQ